MRIPIPLAGVFEAVTASLLEANTYQPRPGEFLQALKNLHAEILRGRHTIAKGLHILIQVSMVEWLDNLPRDVTIEIGKIGDHARGRIDRPRHGDFHNVVVSVSIRVIALAVDSLVFGVVQLRAVQAMRSRQLITPRQFQTHAAPSP